MVVAIVMLLLLLLLLLLLMMILLLFQHVEVMRRGVRDVKMLRLQRIGLGSRIGRLQRKERRDIVTRGYIFSAVALY